MTDRITVRQVGPAGRSAARQLFDAGIIDEPTADAMDERYASQAAIVVDGAPSDANTLNKLNTKLAAETTARAAAITSAVGGEATARTTAISSAVTTLTQADTAEATARSAGDAATLTAANTNTSQAIAQAFVDLRAPVNVVLPVITGTAGIGNVLTASTGTWTRTPSRVLYQWNADGVPIIGAYASTFEPWFEHEDAVITVTVTADTGGAPGYATSLPTTAITGWSPTDLYANGETGHVGDLYAANVLFTNIGGTTPASPGDVIGHVKDAAGGPRWFTVSNNDRRPELDNIAGVRSLQNIGSLFEGDPQDRLISDTPLFPADGNYSVIIGAYAEPTDNVTWHSIIAQRDADTADMWVDGNVELRMNAAYLLNQELAISADRDKAVLMIAGATNGTANRPGAPAVFNVEPTVPTLFSWVMQDGANASMSYANGSKVDDFTKPAVGPTQAEPTHLLSHASAVEAPSRVYGWIIIDRPLTDLERRLGEAWLANKMNVELLDVTDTPVPITATKSITIHVPTGQVVQALNPDTIHSPASLVKQATALVAIEHGDLAATLTMNSTDAGESDDFLNGDPATLEEWLEPLLVVSDNGVARMISRSVGQLIRVADGQSVGSTSEQIAAFMVKVNEKLAELEMDDSVFTSAIGDDPGTVTTARDMAKLTLACRNEPLAWGPMSTAQADFVITGGPNPRTVPLTNSNHLLVNDELGVLGGKTGTSSAAGANLSVIWEHPQGDEFLTVTFGADGSYNRYVDTRAVITKVINDYGVIDGVPVARR